MTIDDHIEEVMDEFDFVRVYQAMHHLGWVWATAVDGVPTIGEMRRQVRKLMKMTYNDAHKFGEDEYTVGTGGFEVYYNKKHDFFDVKFVLTSWRTDYEVIDE